MTNERLLLRGRAAEAKRKYKALTIKADVYISTIREIIDPYAGEFTDYDMEKFMAIAQDFYALWVEANELKTLMKKIDKDLNV